jgi:hypothetical protein
MQRKLKVGDLIHWHYPTHSQREQARYDPYYDIVYLDYQNSIDDEMSGIIVDSDFIMTRVYWIQDCSYSLQTTDLLSRAKNIEVLFQN